MAKTIPIGQYLLDNLTIDEKILKLLPEEVARKHKVLPIRRQGRTLTLAMADPTNISAIDEIRFLTRLELEPVVSSEVAISRAIDRYYGSKGSEPLTSDADFEIIDVELDPEEKHTDPSAAEAVLESAPARKIIDGILFSATQKGATHVHFDPGGEGIQVRFRIDGQLREELTIPAKARAALASTLKIYSNLDIKEKELPQEGYFQRKIGKNTYGVRASSLPNQHGERFMLELTDQRSRPQNIDDLGLLPHHVEKLTRALHRSSGLVLITGPRGSGKTTTLYAALNHLKNEELVILTAEDPIEWTLEGVSQTQINSEIGLSYASALRAMVQQDPDFLMIPEIVDPEVAETVIRIALDGYRLVSSLDTDGAPGALIKLLDLGVEPSRVASAVSLVLSQKLGRKICEACKVEASPSEGELAEIRAAIALHGGGRGSADRQPGFTDQQAGFFVGSGCDQCGGTGYGGRIPFCEVLEVSGGIREALSGAPSPEELREVAIAEGMETLAQNALRRAAAGETSLEECLRVSRDTGRG